MSMQKEDKLESLPECCQETADTGLVSGQSSGGHT